MKSDYELEKFAQLLNPDTRSDVEVLEDFIADNPELETLEELFSKFNFFEAIGATRRELRHSDFLAFILNPSEMHGMGDAFLKPLLKLILKQSDVEHTLSVVDVDIADLDDVEIYREYQNIDLLIVSKTNNFIFCIENKIDSSEHTNQLERYQKIVEREYASFHKAYVFLTPEGISAESDEDWSAFSYSDLIAVMNKVVDAKKNAIGADVYMMLTHYTDMVERNIMSENQISELCEKIYRKHRKAIDLLFEHRPDLYSQTNAKVKELVSYVSPDFQLELDHCTKSYVRFCSLPWDEMPMQTSGDGSWTKSKRVILGEVEVMSSGVCLKLVLGPGDSKFRESVFKLAKANPEFKGCSKSLYEKWTQIYKVVLIKKKEMDEYSWDSIEPLLQQEWERIMYHGEFEKILSILRDLQPDSKGLESKAEEEVE